MDPEPEMSSRLGKSDPDEGGSTTDGSDEDLQSSHSKSLPSRTDKTLASVSTNDSKGIQSEPMALDDDSLTASASDVDESPAITHPVPKPKHKLGKIGGKGKDSSPETPAITTSKPKLGKIGGNRTESVTGQTKHTVSDRHADPVSSKSGTREKGASPKPTDSERRGRTVEQPPEPSPPRETSQERANRKREQLKRELEHKSQAATKKKRRF